ncbi:MAG: RNA polymerase sigma factor [Phycisphaerales bacterium]|nr:RNA polymerase sigma factor [Phycisphaerales bacterium]MCI0676578.1 RNA polymerase sigma factor [Phycisphaerales bacterium]
MASACMSEAKLRSWMQELGPRLIALSAGICRDRHRAEEIVQEAFIKLWKSPPDGGEVVYPSWMRRVVTNLSINSLQRTKRPATLPEYSDDPALRSSRRSDEECDIAESLDRVRAAMDRLDDSKRAILMLRAQEQLSYEDIAVHLGVPVGTVMSRLNRARAALLDEMKKDLKHAEDEPLVFEFRKYKQA